MAHSKKVRQMFSWGQGCLKFLVMALLLPPSPGQAEISLPDEAVPKVIYGRDDRYDFFEFSTSQNPDLQRLSRASVALIDSKLLREAGGERVEVLSTRYADAFGLCEPVRYADQQVAPFCSGVLVGADLVLTAGHCIETSFQCQTTTFAFGFQVEASGHSPRFLPSPDVYACRELIARAETKEKLDFALIRLDRPVSDRVPVDMRQTDTLQPGDQVFMLGYPHGLPQKLTMNGQLRAFDPVYFTTNLDAFTNNSGSPVFNSRTMALEGLLIEGEDDFETGANGIPRKGRAKIGDPSEERQCRVLKHCPDDDCVGEDVVKISAILEYLGWPR